MKAIIVVELPDNWEIKDTHINRLELGNTKERAELLLKEFLISKLSVQLRPMPKKRKVKSLYTYEAGYNDCIDDLVGVDENDIWGDE